MGVQVSTVAFLNVCFENRRGVDTIVHEKMLNIFYLYLIIGGMPEAVDVYLKTNDLNHVARIHDDIIRLYKKDFSKYEKEHKLKLQEIYDAMAGQLNSKSKRFHLNTLGTGMNYDRVVNDFLWLKDAGVALPVYNIQEPKLPLKMSENRSLFKLFFSVRHLHKCETVSLVLCQNVSTQYHLMLDSVLHLVHVLAVTFGFPHRHHLASTGQCSFLHHLLLPL